MRRLRLWVCLCIGGAIVLAGLLTPVLPLANPVRMDVLHRFSAPSGTHLLGQDDYGRDVLSRLLWGARASLGIAGVAAAISCLVGTALGLVAGYVRGGTEFLVVRAMDVILCLPQLLLALLAITLLGSGASTLIPVLAIVYLPGFVRVTYAGTRAARGQDYVQAVQLLGAGPIRIMARTLLPNIAGPVLVQFSLTCAASIMLESGLSFVGLGVLPPASSWGQMIGSARPAMNAAPMLLVWPCLALTVTIFAINGICDGLRDTLDPHSIVKWRRATRPPASPTHGRTGEATLDIAGLTLQIGAGNHAIRPVRAISLQIAAGETLALVGESGSGKSLTGLAAAGLLPPAIHAEAGAVWLGGQDMLRLPEARRRLLRGSYVAMIFQDALSSLNPVQRVGRQVADAARAHARLSRPAAWQRAAAMFARVGIPDPAARLRSYPHQMSGGMRQRVMIAMGIVNAPRLLIADEPTTALDVSIQAQVLDLLRQVQQAEHMAMLFITHSLPVVRQIADRIAVMYAGEIVEQGAARAVLSRPLHPYTRALLDSAPGEDGALPIGIPGLVPPPGALPPGCAFAPRCRLREPACEAARPPLVEAEPNRLTRCIRWPLLA